MKQKTRKNITQSTKLKWVHTGGGKIRQGTTPLQPITIRFVKVRKSGGRKVIVDS